MSQESKAKKYHLHISTSKLLRGSYESCEAANPFQRTLYSLSSGVVGSGLSVRIRSAV